MTASDTSSPAGITCREWIGAFVAGLVFAAVTLVPYVHAARLAPEGKTYAWVFPPQADRLFHLSWARQAMAGNLLFEPKHSGRAPQGARVFNLLFLLMGLTARAADASVLFGFHAVRCLAAALLVPAVYWFASPLIPSARWRWVCVALVLLSSGLGWLPVSGLDETHTDLRWPVELSDAASFRLEVVVGPAVVVLALAMGLVARALRHPTRRRFVFAGLAGAVVAAVHPLDLVLVWGTLGLVCLAWPLVRAPRAGVGRRWRGALLAGLITLPVPLYHAAVVRSDPVYATYASIEHVIPPLTALLGYGLILPPALIGAAAVIRNRRPEGLTAVAWAAVAWAVMLTPWPPGHRLFALHGLHVVLCVLAARGLMAVGASFARRRHGRAVRGLGWALVIAFIALATPSTVNRYAADLRIDPNDPEGPFLSNDFRAAIDWLAANTAQRDVVLAEPWAGQWIAALAGNRTYAGHPDMAPDFNDRLNQIIHLLEARPDTKPESVTPLLTRSGARFILIDTWGDRPPFHPGDLLEREGLASRVFERGFVRVYEVTGRAGTADPVTSTTAPRDRRR